MLRIPLLLFLLILVFPLQAQENTIPERPRVGLVLSGGGAKGMAHVGALKVIEEAGVEIDYIGGTSMGAIVGALYASGYTATELDSMFINTPLATLIQDNLPRDAKTFYEKEDSERYALTLPFDNFKVTFPSAISGGQNIYNELVRLLYHVKDVSDFSELPIPFYCIGTNIETGKEKILDKGYLPEAIMASGTFPSLFEPAEMDGEVIIDGGVLNNYPVYEMQDLGADIIIGVDVQHGLREREELASATEILLQINNFRTVNVMAEKSAATDIYIKPNMQSFSVIDFDLKRTIINKGEEAARNHLAALQEVAALQKEIETPKPEVPQTDSLLVDRLILTGDHGYSRGYIKGKLRFNMNEKTTFKKLRQGISNLSATGNFKTIRYRLIRNEGGEDLVLNLKENPNKTFLRASVHYDDLYKSAALLNLTKKSFLVNDDVASFDLILGDNIRYNMQYYIDKGLYWSIGINSRYNDFDREINYDVITSNFPAPVNPNINNITLDVDDLTNQFYLQTVLREEFSFRIGVEHKYLSYSTTTLNMVGNEGPPDPDTRTFFEKSNYYSAFGKLILDTYNKKYFPSRGLYFNGDFHFYLLSSDFNDNFKEFSIAKARMGAAFPLLNNLSLNLETEGGFKLGTSNVSSFDFVLGGYGNNFINNFIPFFGYDFLSLPGNSYVKAYGRLDLEIAPKNHVMFVANISNVEDDLFRTGEWFTWPDYTGYAVGYGFESFLGPLQVYYSWTPDLNDGIFYFSLGYWF